MKTRIITLLTVLAFAVSAMAHGGIELGPNGGQLVDFGDAKKLQAEFVLKDGKFVVGLYDETAKKEVPVTTQSLTVTHKEANKKLAIEVKDGKWIIAKPDGDDFWFILQIKDDEKAKARNGRLHYDAAICSKCKKAEWLCECGKTDAKVK